MEWLARRCRNRAADARAETIERATKIRRDRRFAHAALPLATADDRLMPGTRF